MPEPKPTRLSPEDLEIWNLFHASNPNFCTDIKFDVRVGDGYDPGPDYSDEIRRDSVMLSQRRIDVVCTFTDKIWLIEITHTASLRAIGQIEVYPYLYAVTFQPTLPLYAVLMYRHCDPDLERYIQNRQLNTLVVP